MREKRPSGSMSGEWKRGMVRLLRHRQTKEPETDRPNLHHRATPRLYGGHKTSLTVGNGGNSLEIELLRMAGDESDSG